MKTLELSKALKIIEIYFIFKIFHFLLCHMSGILTKIQVRITLT